MGYEYSVGTSEFETALDKESFEKELEEFKKLLESKPFVAKFIPDYDGNFEYFTIEHKSTCDNKKKGKFIIEVESCEGKWNDEECLAVFISKVISKKSECKIECNGEDGYTWGFKIIKNKVTRLDTELKWIESGTIEYDFSDEGLMEILL
jgi:hypothetical protein